jgi:hypothetical protein
MSGLSDDGSNARTQLTRRERRIARSRTRRAAALVGWFGYGVGVFVVVTTAAWLAVRGGVEKVPEPVSPVILVEPVIALPEFPTTTTPSARPTLPAPVVDAGIPTTTSTTTPVLSAAATPEPIDTTP